MGSNRDRMKSFLYYLKQFAFYCDFHYFNYSLTVRISKRMEDSTMDTPPNPDVSSFADYLIVLGVDRSPRKQGVFVLYLDNLVVRTRCSFMDYD